LGPLELAQAGPIAILIAGIGLLYRAFVKGDIVPGRLYRDMEARAIRAEKRADQADTQAERNTDALEAVATTVKTALEQRQDPPRG
jgi:hypothetical protein